MKITAIKTRPVMAGESSLTILLDEYLPALPDYSVVAVSSKIVAICEGRTIPKHLVPDKQALIRREAEYYRHNRTNAYHYTLTIKHGVLVTATGIDTSNGNGHYVLWPEDPQASANRLREHLARNHRRRHLGVIITDGHSTPLRRGVTGFGLAHSGFLALRDYAGEPDVFGDRFVYTQSNLLDGLAAGASALMGECGESTPLALLEDLDFIQFQGRDPLPPELAALKISVPDDVYAEMLLGVHWDKQPPAPNSR